MHLYSLVQINVREYRRGNREWTIQRNWQHRVHKTQDEDNQNKKIAQYVLDTTMRKHGEMEREII
jgi:chloramphenicol 3-O-phosphotransferase